MKYKKFETAESFYEYLKSRKINRNINKIIVHQLWVKPQNRWLGEESIRGLREYYKDQGRNFAFHIAIGSNQIWLCKPLGYSPDQSGSEEVNFESVAIEVDGSIGHRDPSEEDWILYCKTINILMKKFHLEPNNIFPHHKYCKSTECPGFSMEYLLQSLIKYGTDNIHT